MRRNLLALSGLGLFLGGLATAAADPAAYDPAAYDPGTGTRDLIVELGVGGLYAPRFEGSDRYLLSPYPIVKLHYLRIPGLYETGRAKAIYFRPSFRFLGDRDPSDDPIVRGLRPVDWALELGAAVGYETRHFHAFVDIRKGFNGHTGWVADLGVDGVLRPTSDLTLKAGPRVSFADDDYMDTYFSVSRRESVRSGYAAYNPSGGIKSVGVAGLAEYRWTPETSLYLRASYDRLVSDAGDSPIVKAGERNMFGIGIGVSYRFGLDLFD